MKGLKKKVLALAEVLLLFAFVFQTASAKVNFQDLYPTEAISRDEIMLWPGTAPGSEGLQLTQKIIEKSTNPNLHSRTITGVAKPSIIPFFPKEGEANGTAVLICPGGAYHYLAFDKEGYDIAQWLNSIGVAAFVLKYRLPAEGHRQGYNVPLEDAQRAMRIIRQNAKKWGIDGNKVGVAGFSAGGHLAATLGTKYEQRVYRPVDGADQLSAKPNFMILGYPVISMKGGITNLLSRQKLLGANPSKKMIARFSNELHVDAGTPPTFIVHAHNDAPVPVEGSILFYNVLKKAHVEAEIHIFRTGGHGFGIRSAKGSLALWTTLAEEWLASTGFINEPAAVFFVAPQSLAFNTSPCSFVEAINGGLSFPTFPLSNISP